MQKVNEVKEIELSQWRIKDKQVMQVLKVLKVDQPAADDDMGKQSGSKKIKREYWVQWGHVVKDRKRTMLCNICRKAYIN